MVAKAEKNKAGRDSDPTGFFCLICWSRPSGIQHNAQGNYR
nr:MAG TPA: hypothetical protein [Caudoviricetes sp.]DAV25629.1 MAG TPA: hypothetical protein [Caudoviricetes sp.]